MCKNSLTYACVCAWLILVFILLAFKSYWECNWSSFASSWCGSTKTHVVYNLCGYKDDRGGTDFSKTPKLSPSISSPPCLSTSDELHVIDFQQSLGALLDRSLFWRLSSLPENGYDLPHLPGFLPSSFPCTAATSGHHFGYCIGRALPYSQEYSLPLHPLKKNHFTKLFCYAVKVSSKSFFEMNKSNSREEICFVKLSKI